MSRIATTLLLGVLLAGCANTTPEWDRTFGDSVRQARARQLIDPAAASRRPPPEGVDGKAAVGAHKTYAESFGFAVQEPRPAQLNVGTERR